MERAASRRLENGYAPRRNLQGELVGHFWRSGTERSGNAGHRGEPEPSGRGAAGDRSTRTGPGHAIQSLPFRVRRVFAEPCAIIRYSSSTPWFKRRRSLFGEYVQPACPSELRGRSVGSDPALSGIL